MADVGEAAGEHDRDEAVTSPTAIAALAAANKAGVSVTVDCQCDGIFINGIALDDTNGVALTGVPAEIVFGLRAHSRELETLLRCVGWWCGCEDRHG